MLVFHQDECRSQRVSALEQSLARIKRGEWCRLRKVRLQEKRHLLRRQTFRCLIRRLGKPQAIQVLAPSARRSRQTRRNFARRTKLREEAHDCAQRL